MMGSPATQPPEANVLELRNSILMGDATVCSDDWRGLIRSTGWLVHGGAGGCTIEAGIGDLMATDPGILPLADNGGDTLTHALEASSPIVGAGEPGGCTDGMAPISHDQRGHRRATADCTPGAYSN